MKRIIIAMCFILSISANNSFSGETLAHWTFDEGVGDTLFDVSGNENHGIINGGEWIGGIKGMALKFNAKNEENVRVPKQSFLEPKESFSIEAWVLCTEGQTYPNAQILRKANHLSDGYTLVWSKENNRITTCVDYHELTMYDNVSNNEYLNEWTYVVVNISQQSSNLYVNGVLKDSYSGTVTLNHSGDILIGGGIYGSFYTFINGALDEIRIKSGNLSENEIIENYDNLTGNVNPLPVLAHWTFDEGEGDILNDISGNENHGTIKGAKWVAGVNGNALEFDGCWEDYVRVPVSKTLESESAFAIETWVYAAPNQPNPNSQILRKSAHQDHGYTLVWSKENDKITYCTDYHKFTLYDKNVNSAHTEEWTHIFVNVAQDSAELFVNGELVDKYLGNTLMTHSDDLYIGGGTYGLFKTYFTGFIDETIIYGSVVPETVIKENYLRYADKPVTVNSSQKFLSVPFRFVNNSLKVNTKSDYILSVYNLKGRLIKRLISAKLSNKNIVNLGDLSSGTYIAQLDIKGNISAKQFVID